MSSDFIKVEEEEDILQVTKTYRQSLSDQIKAFRQEQRSRTNPVIQKLTEDQKEIMDKKCEELARERNDLKAIVARLMQQNLGKEPTIQLHHTTHQQNGGKANGHHPHAPQSSSTTTTTVTTTKPNPVVQNKPPIAQKPAPIRQPEKTKFKSIFSGREGSDIDDVDKTSSAKGKGPMYSDDIDDDEEKDDDALLKPVLKSAADTKPLVVMVTFLDRFLKWEDLQNFFSKCNALTDEEANKKPLSDYIYYVAGLLVFYAKSLGSLALTDLASGTLKKPVALGPDAPNCTACVNAQFVKPTVSGLMKKPPVVQSCQKMQIGQATGKVDGFLDVCKTHGLGLTFWKTILEITRLDDSKNGKKLLTLCNRMAGSVAPQLAAQGLDVIFAKDWLGCTWLPDCVCEHIKHYYSSCEKPVNVRPRDGDELQPPKKRRKIIEEEDGDNDINM
jgi:hypothetical protein